jgi:methylglyoxal synthase
MIKYSHNPFAAYSRWADGLVFNERVREMEIAIIADDNKKELMAQFCIAYCGILSRHHICATHTTGSYIADATGLDIETYLSGHTGGVEQIASRVSFDEIDVVFYFRSTDPAKSVSEAEMNLLRLCDVYNIPLATNIATAEVLVTALESGSLNWRELVNPRSEYNINKRRKKKRI